MNALPREEVKHLRSVNADLLEALKALLNGTIQHGMMADHGPALRAAARAAIAKAEGTP